MLDPLARFDPAIYPELWADTEGQPWLVNAFGHELTWNMRELGDRSRPSPLDEFPTDAVQYVENLGLIASRPQIRIANRIYREVIPRELTWVAQSNITHEQPWYVRADQRLDIPKLLAAFQQFFREHSQAWIEGFDYKEAGPQLLIHAFVQRIVYGGGRIQREYGLGRRRTDLLIEWPLDEQQGFFGPVQRVVIELKLYRKGSLDAPIAEGPQQTADYADKAGTDEAHLVVFDRRGGVPWKDKIWQRSETVRRAPDRASGGGVRTIGVWGC